MVLIETVPFTRVIIIIVIIIIIIVIVIVVVIAFSTLITTPFWNSYIGSILAMLIL